MGLHSGTFSHLLPRALMKKTSRNGKLECATGGLCQLKLIEFDISGEYPLMC